MYNGYKEPEVSEDLLVFRLQWLLVFEFDELDRNAIPCGPMSTEDSAEALETEVNLFPAACDLDLEVLVVIFGEHEGSKFNDTRDDADAEDDPDEDDEEDDAVVLACFLVLHSILDGVFGSMILDSLIDQAFHMCVSQVSESPNCESLQPWHVFVEILLFSLSAATSYYQLSL
ncbi:hypothetical protein FBU30_000368 [Linnemannia zychae]|nr:hypothetical protein FBU30_000368 [Linnemannia zychae]